MLDNRLAVISSIKVHIGLYILNSTTFPFSLPNYSTLKEKNSLGENSFLNESIPFEKVCSQEKQLCVYSILSHNLGRLLGHLR